MSEPIKTNADVMREVADGHDEVVRHLETARERGNRYPRSGRDLWADHAPGQSCGR